MSDSVSTPTADVDNGATDRTGTVRTATVLAGIIVAALVATVAATLATAVIGSRLGETATFVVGIVGIELSFIVVGITYLRFRSSFRLPVRPPTRQELPYLIGGLLASLVTAFLSLAITDAIIPAFELSPGYTEYSRLGDLTGIGFAFGAILSFTLIGPTEEFFFRGVMQGRLREAFSPVSAVGIAGAAFALFHVYPVLLLSPPLATIAHMAAYYTLMGMIFGWVYYRTDNLVVPALVHGIFNAVLFTSALWI
ncbi:CAAX amino terminal protease [Halogeometricum borinquense DSM 11551]|uniref:CAAX amino terminal protease n=1 Tax=Halogeometricum borinquense (strain ATCC 700274 / DSM 11551 / JCM 10706 / KCTC 4070 / PR3) TaxID=469382 RepID=E4NVH6_HALBP|nr:CPBP family intramembrane glutamic endopeptidase [Halogeometricum borinquense]ADQ68860.1 CAAX amino terminal protease family [Halogeometricum borinquense DSM 11551]ELY28712.1 CAAX amino terminal protease [Halogeometricum borinquense DSM 11551]